MKGINKGGLDLNLECTVTCTTVVASVQSIDFGKCTVVDSACEKLTVTNHSALPQEFGFVKLPSSVEVAPADGFGVLPAFGSQEFSITFSPKYVGHQADFSLKIVTELNQVNDGFAVV